MKKDAFTLLELIMVVIIIAILVSIALPQYTKSTERAKDQEAITNLNLIKTAELIYYAELGQIYGPQGYDGGNNNANESAINTALRLNLPTAISATSPLTWDYYISAASSVNRTFTAIAQRTTANGSPSSYQRQWTITEGLVSSCAGYLGGSCP